MRFRFKKGDRVEVLSKGEVPLGSWRYGIIMSGNGHTYYIHYENPTSTTSAPVLQRVPRKSIRPCPPTEDIKRWASGDFVEVFENSSWKFGQVLKVADVNLFFVKLLGTSQKVKAHKSCIRLPRSWQDEEWVLIQKIPGDIESRNSDHQFAKIAHHSVDSNKKMRQLDGYCPSESEAGFQMSHAIPSRTSKRGSPCNLARGADQKFRAIEKDGKLQRIVPENCMHDSLKHKETGFSEINPERTQNGDTRYSAPRNLEPKVAEKSACSVGSSGTSNTEETLDETYQLALDAYYHIMKSLGELGYLTWEQEEMITDLRMKLNISNDEHLMELRKLVSVR